MLAEVVTPEDLEHALASGVFAEGHRLEVKREIPSGRGANLELARDLASLGVDGGTLVVGVAEDKSTGTFTAHPCALAGLFDHPA